MGHFKLFEEFHANENESCEISAEEQELFKRLVKSYTDNEKHLDVEDEAALLALCNKMNLKPTDVYQDNLIKNFRKTDEAIISHRTELFLNKLICNYKSGTEEEKVLRELCAKLGEDFDSMLKTCKRK